MTQPPENTEGIDAASAGAAARFRLLNRERYRLLPIAILLGLAVGLLGVVFHKALDWGEHLRLSLVHGGGPLGWEQFALAILLPIITTGFAVWLVRRFAPEAAGGGISHLKAALQGYRMLRWPRVILVKFISCVVGISGGLAFGRAGPTVHMGGALGKGIGSMFKCAPNEERALIAAGGGAGLAAALNTPLAGVVLVLEELQGNFASLTLFVAIVTCLSADLVGRLLLGHLPVFHVPVHHVPDLASVAASLSLGLVAGVLGALFNKGMILATRFHRRTGGRGIAAWAVVCGAAIGVTGWFYPDLLGSGQRVAGMILADGLDDSALIAAFFALRFILTLGSNGTGAAGGLFIPTLVLGALLGAAWESVVQEWIPAMGGETTFFAVVGMAALFSGIMRTPLTAIILIVEMTGSYSLILPLMAACFAAVLIADLCRTLPINEALLEDDLRSRPLRVEGGF